jgi:hypothetical protein
VLNPRRLSATISPQRGNRFSLPMNPKMEVGKTEARPHPGPLPRGEGETLAASWQYGGVGLAVVHGFNARNFSGNSLPILPLQNAESLAATLRAP